MTLKKTNYMPRLVDNKMERYLRIFGAVSVEGPKWCGKTWTGLSFANSVAYLTEKNVRELAKIDPNYVFSEEKPQLLDEWQIVPSVWDAVRHACDESDRAGNFILTGSTTLEKAEAEEEVFHSGTGRIATIRMETMSLQESKDSSGRVSISGMLNGVFRGANTGKVGLEKLAKLIVRGGWPENLKMDDADATEIPKSYIESVITKDIYERKDRKRDSGKMRMLLKSLARNESAMAGNDALVRDIEEYGDGSELIESRHTIADYLGVLDALYLTANQPAFAINYRSAQRVGKTPKRHLVDPSLSCALLGMSAERLIQDLRTFGFMFEALAERDLRVYMNYLGGELRHFRDNASGDEVDAILEFGDGRYAAVEIKLSSNLLQDGLKSLMNFYGNVERKPEFMCVIVGNMEAAYQDPETGIYVTPLTELGV